MNQSGISLSGVVSYLHVWASLVLSLSPPAIPKQHINQRISRFWERVAHSSALFQDIFALRGEGES